MMSAVVEKFWMVQGIGPGCGLASILHWKRSDATNEAKRLAAMHKNSIFYVMEAQYGYTGSPDNVANTSAQKITIQVI